MIEDAFGDQWHAMVDETSGDVFYPDSPEDAAHFAEHHGAVPVWDETIRGEMGEHTLCGQWPCADCAKDKTSPASG